MQLKLYMKKTAIFFIIILVCSAAATLTAFAAPPSGGTILSEEKQQKLQETIEKMQPAPPDEEIETAPESAQAPGMKFFVKKIEFTGYDSAASLEELNKITAPYLKKEATFADLERLAYNITKHLRERSGFLLSRAYLPEQDVTDGIVKIAIVPGSLDGKIEVTVIKPYRINERLLESMASHAIPEDKAIRLKSVERAILLMNELPGISSRAYLDKGKSPGTTKLSIEAKEDKWFSGMVYGDNFGNDSTGAFRRIAQVSFGDSLHQGDLLQFTYINSNYLNQGVAHLSFPLGPRGLFVDFACNGLHYELKGKLKSLNGNGYAVTSNANIRYPLILTRTANLWIGGGYDYYYLDDRFGGISYSRRNISAGNAIIKGNLYDSIFGGGLTYFLVSLNGGGVDLRAGMDLDDAGARTDGGYFRATYLAARLQRATKDISLLFSARGQVSSCNLDASQKIILGGPTGVRAYPVGEAAADEGDVLTFESRFDLSFMPPWLKTQLVGFYDAGYVVSHKDTW